MRYFLRKLALIAGLSILSHNIQAQPWMQNIPDKNNPNFFEIQKAFNDYWAAKGVDDSKIKGSEGEHEDLAGYYQFKRWEWFMGPRISPTGALPDPMIAYNEWKKFKDQSSNRTEHVSSLTSNWIPLGPFAVPDANSGQHGAGRINAITMNPLNANILYVGSPAGGFWRSNNGGTSWTPTGDFNATIGISDIAVDPSDTSIIYIATGDKDAGDTYSAGILKSTNGGMTWNTTGLNWSLSFTRKIGRIIIKPDSTNIILAATSDGVMRSTNGGTTWTTVFNVSGMMGLELKPSHPEVVYACSNTGIYRSINGGITFSAISSGLPGNGMDRVAIAVTPNDTNYLYVLMSANDYSYFGLYRSADGGNTFTLRSNSPNILGMLSDGSSPGGQGWYDLALAVSPTAANTVMVGGINVWSSTNGGTNWSCVGRGCGSVNAPSHIHPDVHSLYFKPGSGTVVYCCNDGGVFKSTKTGSQWNDISSGLQIMEFYSISSSQTSATIIIGGAQDNGGNLYSNGSWASVAAGDGMIVAIDYSDESNMFEEQPFGDLFASND